jgi:hypothetical protein
MAMDRQALKGFARSILTAGNCESEEDKKGIKKMEEQL